MTVHSLAIFDSGLGGLSVLQHLRRRVPAAEIAYLADQARAPYGDRSEGEVRRFSREVASHVLGQGAGVIVVACNTASSVALETLRHEYDGVPIVGMEPAVKPAATATRSGVVGVLATTRTVEGERLARLIDRHADGVEVIAQPCPGLVELVEDGLSDSEAARASVRGYVEPLLARGADTLVLGCTHYSFLRSAFEEAAGPSVTVIDPAEAVARHAATFIDPTRGRATTRYETTGDPVRFRRQLEELIGESVPTHRVDVSELALPSESR